MDSFVETLGFREKELIAALESTDKELSEIQSRSQQLQRELDLVSGLLDLHDSERSDSLKSSDSLGVSDDTETGIGIEINHLDRASGSQFESNVAGILAASGQPMHISEIDNRLRENKVPIPGKGTIANIITRMRRANGLFVRVASGTYGLSEWGVEPMKPNKKARRRVRRNGGTNG